ncbi:hypothetical protein KCU65_g417, partial [Aureobasidium melanogenum]
MLAIPVFLDISLRRRQKARADEESRPREGLSKQATAGFVVKTSARDTRLRSPPDTPLTKEFPTMVLMVCEMPNLSRSFDRMFCLKQLREMVVLLIVVDNLRFVKLSGFSRGNSRISSNRLQEFLTSWIKLRTFFRRFPANSFTACVFLCCYTSDGDVLEDNTKAATIWSVHRQLIHLHSQKPEHGKKLLTRGFRSIIKHRSTYPLQALFHCDWSEHRASSEVPKLLSFLGRFSQSRKFAMCRFSVDASVSWKTFNLIDQTRCSSAEMDFGTSRSPIKNVGYWQLFYIAIGCYRDNLDCVFPDPERYLNSGDVSELLTFINSTT